MATPPIPGLDLPPQAKVAMVQYYLNFIFSPRQSYEQLVRKPRWILPVIMLTLTSLSIIFIFTDRVGWERFMREQFASNPRMQETSAEQREQAVTRAASFARIAGYIQGAIGPTIFVLILSGIMLGAFNLLGGAGADYKTSLAITSHSMLPGVISGTLGVIILLIKDPDEIDLQNLVGSNLGILVGNDSPRWLASLAGSFDLFVFWMMFLLARGFSTVYPKKLSMGKALGIILGLWGVFVIAKVGWASAFS